MSGRDIIGIAKTGSGKTAAFVIPMIVHIMDQRIVEPGEGPIGLIVAPTHELAHQIYLETVKFSKYHDIRSVLLFSPTRFPPTCSPFSQNNVIRVAAVYGGASKHEQAKELKGGVEIIVCTPVCLHRFKSPSNHRQIVALLLPSF